jgi:hypothetical protein
MKALFITLGLVALILTPLFVSTCKDSTKKKNERAEAEAAAAETTMDFTPKNRAQMIIDDYGIKVIGFCWQDRPFLVASKTGFGGDGLQLLRVEGWCQ